MLYNNIEVIIMIITATELRKNLGKYLNLLDDEEIIITKNGKEIAVLSKSENDKQSILKDLLGVINLDDNLTLESIKDERIRRQ